jgi:hypothetical protein
MLDAWDKRRLAKQCECLSDAGGWENAWIVQLYCAVDFTIRSQDEGNDRLAGTRNCYRFRKMGSAMADIRN